MPDRLSPAVRARIRADFAPGQHTQVASALAGYTGPERARVQCAVLQLADGALDNVRAYVRAAEEDFRDVLMWVERPPRKRRTTRADEVRAALRRADQPSGDLIEDCWFSPALRPLEAELLPVVIEQYRSTYHSRARAALIHHVTGLAPTHDAAVELGVEALGDRSVEVRYRACGLLAFSGHPEAAEHLGRLVRSGDEQTARYARAALEADTARDLSPFTALDAPRRRFYTLPGWLPCRADWPTFAQELDAFARAWLVGLGLEPHGVFGHNAFYRAGDLWFHAEWEGWDGVWLFFLGPRTRLASCPLRGPLRRAGVREPIPNRFRLQGRKVVQSSTVEGVSRFLKRALPRALEVAWPSVKRGAGR
jgi:hypothetical protein